MKRAFGNVIAKILTLVNVPREPAANGDAPARYYYDVTGEPVPAWAVGVDPDPDEPGPPQLNRVVAIDGLDENIQPNFETWSLVPRTRARDIRGKSSPRTGS
jgi:hypothetical protein